MIRKPPDAIQATAWSLFCGYDFGLFNKAVLSVRRIKLSALSLNPFDSVANLELHLDPLDPGQGGDGEGRGEGEDPDPDQDSGFNNTPGSGDPAAFCARHRYSTPRRSDVFLRAAPSSGLVSDLLSELHFSDSQKLKQQLLEGPKTNGLAQHRYSTPRRSDVFLRAAPSSGLVSDLLSELHFSDSQKLKQQLLQ
ncbi:hypothetical protein CRUP_034186, partial [Coryphaenoides rupestris]